MLGMRLSQNPSFKVIDVIVTDKSPAASRRGYHFPAATAKGLEPKVHDGHMPLDEFYNQLLAGMTEVQTGH